MIIPEKSWRILDKTHKKGLYIVLFLGLFSAVLEFIGIGLLIPSIMLILDYDFQYNDILSKYLTQKNLNFFENNKFIFLYLLGLIFILKNLYLIWLNKVQVDYVEKVRNSASQKIFRSYLSKLYKFHLDNNPSILFRNASSETVSFSAYIKDHIVLVSEIILISTMFVFLLFFNLKFTLLIIFIVSFFSAFYYLIFSNYLKKWGKLRQGHLGDYYKSFAQTFRLIKEIKMHTKEGYFFSKAINSQKLSYKYDNLTKYLLIVPRILLETIFIIVIIFTSVLLLNQNYSSNDIILLLGIYSYAALRIIPSAGKILQSLSDIRYKMPAANLITEELTNKKNFDIDNKINFFEINNLNKKNFKKLDLNKINFFYSNENKPIIKNLNFSISTGEILGVFGPSGSGKTTFLNIICGLLEPNSGIINYNDMELNYKKYTWRSLFGYIPQDVELIDENIKQNIALGVDENEINFDRLKYSIQLSKLNMFINQLPDNYDSLIGESGSRISGGQKQRLGIARALYLKPEILIFDEGTNSLDKDTERKIFDDLLAINANNNQTIIIVSHEIELLKKYTQRIVYI